MQSQHNNVDMNTANKIRIKLANIPLQQSLNLKIEFSIGEILHSNTYITFIICTQLAIKFINLQSSFVTHTSE